MTPDPHTRESLRRAPWTAEQVANLADFQAGGEMHPFTCEQHSSTRLLPTRQGWICSEMGCDYTQDWAHEFALSRRDDE